MNYLLCILESLLAVNLLVVVHEFGHMIAGRLFRVHSHRFCIGLGPRLIGFKFRGTDFCLSPVPLGGYVQLDSDHEHGAGRACMRCISPWKKMLVYFAGPAFNLIFVVLLFWTAFFVLGYEDNLPVVGEVSPEAPAAAAGIRPGDRILEINGRKIVSWTQASVASERLGGGPLRLRVLRSSAAGEGGGFPAEPPGGEPALLLVPEGGLAGLSPVDETRRLRLGPLRAAEKSVEKLVQLSGLLLESFTGLMTTRVSPSELVGPVYLFHISAQTASQSQVSLVYLLAVISACLFFFNLLPLPVLDGGQIVLALLERVLKRPLAPQSVRLLMHASVVWLILLMASATLNDIARLLGT